MTEHMSVDGLDDETRADEIPDDRGAGGHGHDALARDLMRPSAYPHAPSTVERIQTHFSNVFLAGDRVYKIKKPVKLPFADFSTQERRRELTERELELNRQHTEGVYLGVEDVRFDRQRGYSIGGPGRVVEVALKMRRLAAERSLAALVERHEVDEEEIRAIARQVAAWHRQAPVIPPSSELGSYRAVRSIVGDNIEELESYVGTVLEPRLYADLQGYTLAFLELRQKDFDDRKKAGLIRECHGDLHAGNIFVELAPDAPRGRRVQVIDAIEFNPRLSANDPTADMAFLAMDLEHLGRHDLAVAWAEAYITASGDDGVAPLLTFYEVYRALVRCKVTALLRDQETAETRRVALASEARVYGELAVELAARERSRCLVITAGTAGSGKSTVARALAEQWRMEHLQTDVVRKELAGLDRLARTDSPVYGGLYSPAMSEKTYAELARRADLALAEGRSVILDGTHLWRERRLAAAAVGRRHGVRVIILECSSQREEQLRRIAARGAAGTSVSEGGPEVMAKNETEWQRVADREADAVVRIDTTPELAQVELELFLASWRAILARAQ